MTSTSGEGPTVRLAFEAMLADGPLLLSGACGTELLRRGIATPLPLWSAAALLEAPDVVRDVHRDYVRAGARIVTANTFRTDRRTLARAGLASRTRDLVKRALRLAREGVRAADPARPVLVAGSLSPIEDCYRPDLVPDDAVLRVEHGVKVGHLVAAGAAFAMVETMNAIREAEAALGACRAGGLPAVVSFVCDEEGRLLSGESLPDAARAVEPWAPMAVGVNCCAPPVATRAVDLLCRATERPVAVYANGRGRPDADQGWRFRGGVSTRAYLREARRWLDRGARLIGGCCGTRPRTIRGLARCINRRRP
ncbi:MAG: homocysteine S-methyltransferase family protein [Planctomycetota bacterium]